MATSKLLQDGALSVEEGVSSTQQDKGKGELNTIDSGAVAVEVFDVDQPVSTSNKCVNPEALVQYRELPQWYQDNDFVRGYYRPPYVTALQCAKSMFSIHNETGNIWTHFLGIFYVLALLAWTPHAIRDKGWDDVLAVELYLISFLMCLSGSTIFHTMIPHSHRMYNRCCRIDYTGIAALVYGSNVPFVYFMLYDSFTLKSVYLSIMTVFAVLVLIVCYRKKFQYPQYRPLRTWLFLGFGVSGLSPAVHVFILRGFDEECWEMLWPFTLMGASYVVGAVFYVSRVPERWFQGKLDLVGHSHQIWHLLVLSGGSWHFYGVMNLVRIVHESDPPSA